MEPVDTPRHTLKPVSPVDTPRPTSNPTLPYQQATTPLTATALEKLDSEQGLKKERPGVSETDSLRRATSQTEEAASDIDAMSLENDSQEDQASSIAPDTEEPLQDLNDTAYLEPPFDSTWNEFEPKYLEWKEWKDERDARIAQFLQHLAVGTDIQIDTPLDPHDNAK
ncbi:hypothetical protein DBV05_g2418 [Lasiodiplodia theobromae]|uniref:Uncharacterized protein n=1 Tax=Lasiodiplodia theobromae TaxID=45133 RepID=A0A5N5DQ86_9PEZI|nr:hypothetical protein DBV05_g2418 [Lasiodiplodia theobromae]